MGAAGFMVGMLLTAFGYQAGEVQSATTLSGLALMLTVIPGAFHALMGALMFKYRITDRYYNDMKASGAIEGMKAEPAAP